MQKVVIKFDFQKRQRRRALGATAEKD